MTNKQRELVEKIRESWTQLSYGDAEKYEVKVWEVSDDNYFVSVVLEVGSKNDEGTLAQVFCRQRVQIFIYKGGKMIYPISKTLKNGKWKYYYKNLNGRIDLFRVYVEQHCQ